MNGEIKYDEINKLKEKIKKENGVDLNDKLIKCNLCNIYVKLNNYNNHKNSDNHKNKLIGKYCVKSNGKEYYYNESDRQTEKYKKYHSEYIRRKVNCDKCNKLVIYSSMWRHKKSTKCLLFKKNL